MTFPILGDNPPQQTTGPAPNQPPQQGPPPPIDFGEGLRFYVRMQDNPDLEDLNQPKALFRFKITEQEIVTDLYDRRRDMWLDWPNMIAFTGIGGAEDFFEVGEDEANDLIQQWNELQSTGEDEPLEEGETPATEGEAGGLSDDLIKDDMRAAFDAVRLTPEEVQSRLGAAEAALEADEEADLRPDFEREQDQREDEEDEDTAPEVRARHPRKKKKKKKKKKKRKGGSY